MRDPGKRRWPISTPSSSFPTPLVSEYYSHRFERRRNAPHPMPKPPLGALTDKAMHSVFSSVLAPQCSYGTESTDDDLIPIIKRSNRPKPLRHRLMIKERQQLSN